MYGIALILVLTIAGGAIAFIGDRLGTKIGKKKLSLFGLRPKHTSTLVTIATGLLITITTFGIMAAVSENVRTALFGMEKLNRRMAETQTKLSDANAQLGKAQQETEKSQAALKKSQDDVNRLAKQQNELEKRTADLQSEKTRLQSDNSQLKEKNTAMEGDNARLKKEQAELEKQTESLKNGLEAMRGGSIIFQAGEVIASGVVPKGLDAAGVKKAFNEIIEAANQENLLRMGYVASQHPELARVQLSQQEYDEAVASMTSDGEKKTGGKGYAVRIVAFANMVLGEPVRCDVEVFENKLIYQQDEFVHGMKFENAAGLSREEIEGLVGRFFQEINIVASEKGVVPDSLRGSVGVIDGSQVYEMVEALEKLEGPSVLLAYAQSDTYTLGPLRLKLGIGRLNGALGLGNEKK
ncbi:MAG: DUF3084 domain-containing protein [Selenomonadaceae bacterium]|nr:DUF3084 domain-containing protein [Selenomonadaceae bacterium]